MVDESFNPLDEIIDPNLITTDNIVKKYKVDRATVARWRKAGMPVMIWLGEKSPRYDPKEVMDWLKRKERSFYNREVESEPGEQK